ncbi:MAG: selenium metabolism-associated LysR family transcriptional regulator [Bacillota bacterium]|nr:selenium metabolism-associated LysR family transcriptional regulator [Bacillota bacterium]
MDFEQIRAFINVASLKSFSEAGEKMFISQPSVSVRIKALEEELGVILLDRSRAREPVLTEAGRIFLDYAQSIINLQDECRMKLSGQREDTGGLVYIGSSTVPGIYLLPGLLAGFTKDSTSVDFNITILDTSAVLEGLLNYSYDLGFVGLVKPEERLTFIPLVNDELVLCTGKGLLGNEIYPDGVPVKELFRHHLIMREKGSATRQLMEKEMTDHGHKLSDFRGITYINSMEGTKQAVKEGLGIAILSKLSIQDMLEANSIDIYRIKGIEIHRQLYLVYHHSRVLGSAAQKFKDYAMTSYSSE